MADTFTIDSIHPEAGSMVLTVNIGGITYPSVVPILTTQDATLLSTQLQALAAQMRDQFATLTAIVKAADAAIPPVSAAVTALVGTAIPVDTTPVPVPAPTPTPTPTP